ncbi:MAG: YihY/virulence factor BrkB family protein [Terriglobia bacterium]|jgi:YihY family inner membrane protein
MAQRMWKGRVAAEIEKLRRAGMTRAGLADLLRSSMRYIFETEVHAYAFSIAANALLSFFPFTLILLAVCRRWLHWENAYRTILQLLSVNLPYGADFVIRNLVVVVQGRPRLQVVSVLMLFFTSSGVFLPLEIALNKVWGFQRNRSFLKNQAMSFTLALVSGLLALCFILAITPVEAVITFLMGWIPSQGLRTLASHAVLEIASVPLAVSIYFMIYYFLPNGKVPVARVFPAAIATGIIAKVGEVIYSRTLPMFRFREVYGPFETSATLLLWAYLGALILLFGAHLSAHMFESSGVTQVEPAPDGVRSAEWPDNI